MNCELVVLGNKLLQVVVILIRSLAHYFSGACAQLAGVVSDFFLYRYLLSRVKACQCPQK